jgi:hypothetical protein
VEPALEHHPGLRPIRPGHDVRCWLYHDLEGNLIERGPAASGGAAS